MKPTTLGDFENQLNQSESVAQLDEALMRYMASWKISGYTFSYFSVIRNRTDKLRYQLVSKKMQAWHDYYHQENYDEADHTYQEVSKSLIPIFWDTRAQLKDAKTEKDRRLRQESIDFGVTIGLSLPVHAPQGDYGELTLRQFKDETCLNHWQTHKYEWQCAAVYYFHHLKLRLALSKLNGIESHLTQREMQCLQLLMQNHNTREIANLLNTTERTVNFHIQNINHKFGTRNKYQSVAKAILLLGKG